MLKLLLVEDDPTMQITLQRAMGRRGFGVQACGDGTQALALWTSVQPDVVVLDLSLPGLDGLQVLEQVRKRNLGTPVLVLTARGTVGDRVLGYDGDAVLLATVPHAAVVSPAAVGLEVTAFVSLSLDREQFRNVREVERNVMAFPEIVECHTISGDFDYLLKVVAADLKSLSLFLTDRLMQVPGVSGVRSMICMEEIKPHSSLPT